METQPYFQPGRLYTQKEVLQGLHISVHTVHRMRKAGNFPKPVTLGTAQRWRGEDMLLIVAHGDKWKEAGAVGGAL